MFRSRHLQDFLSASELALAKVTGPGAAVAAEVVRRWSRPPALSDGSRPASALPVCDWIIPALGGAAPSPLGTAFAALQTGLLWHRRASADPGDHRFWNGHANALILGPDGYESRTDVMIGASVMAPDVLYPDHNHPPAEVYLPLSAGEWWNADMNWTDPGLSGHVYNPPGIMHAMRSGKTPFLALWFLPL